MLRRKARRVQEVDDPLHAGGGPRQTGGDLRDRGGDPPTAIGDPLDETDPAATGDTGDGDKGVDPLDAAQERRVRAVLALGGVPQSDLLDGVQQVRLRLLERAASGREAPRDVYEGWSAAAL